MNILAVGDIHAPATHPGYMAFCQDLASKYNCGRVVLIGDVVDHHSISQHERHPDAEGVSREYEQALQQVQEWHSTFPGAKVCEGNHDARVIRQAASVAIPSRFLKGYRDLWETPSWEWKPDFIIDDVYYFHGTGCSGEYPAPVAMKKMLMSVVMGHVHSAAGIWWKANPQKRIFGMSLGCGVDDKHIAFAYGENLKVRSILGAGVVLDGTPMHFIMQCGRGEKYDRARFKAKRGK